MYSAGSNIKYTAGILGVKRRFINLTFCRSFAFYEFYSSLYLDAYVVI